MHGGSDKGLMNVEGIGLGFCVEEACVALGMCSCQALSHYPQPLNP